MSVRQGFFLLTLCAALAVRAADRSWLAAGDGSWSNTANWSGGVLPGSSDTALFNNTFASGSVVTMDGGTSLVAKIKVDNPDNLVTRVFAGSQAVRSNEFVKGRTELRGTWLSNYKGSASVGQASGQTAWLTFSGGAVLSATNQHALYVGNANNALGRVTVRDNARLTLSSADTDMGISLGRAAGSVGSFVQEGGTVESVGRFMPGYYGYGAYELLGGVLNLPYGLSNSRYRLAVQVGSTGLFYQRGGELWAASNGVFDVFFFDVGSGNNNAAAVYYADGGVAHIGMHIRLLSEVSTSASASYGELTVDKAGVVQADGTVYLRSTANTSAGTAVVNLNRGGTLRALNIARGKSGGPSCLNGDGGVLEMANSGALSTFLSSVGAVKVYEGGLCLRHAGAGETQITGLLSSPGGWGVAGVAVGNGGSGFVAPPRVAFAGGGGSNASAVAFIDYATGSVTGVVVTCRGEGYGSGDTVSASFSGGGGSGGAASAVLAENRAGPLVKSGTPRLVVYGQPNFAGEYVAREGLFLQSSSDAGAPHLAAVRVSGDGARFQNGSGTVVNNTSDKWDLINPAATLYLGGDFGGGELMLPCGAADTVFQQHYGALKLGFGRSQLTTASQNATNGAALILGSLTRAPGSALRVTETTNLTVWLTGGGAVGSVRPVLPGVSIGDVTTLTTLDSGRLVLLNQDDGGFGEGSNYWVQVSAAAEGAAVNSLRLDDAKTLTLQEDGATVVGSGMVAARAGTAAGTRVSGGSLTSGNGADLILFDFHNAIERRNVTGGKTGLIADSLITDNGAVPVALFALGRVWDPASQSIATGPAVGVPRTTNTYSGGTYILDAALAVAGDGSLGAVPAQPTNNIFASGMAMLRAPADNTTVNLHANRRVRVCGGGLTFFGDTGSQAGRVLFNVAGDISGEGVLVMNHWTGAGVRSVVALGGDNRVFEGVVAVHGMLRLTGPNSLPPKANLLLCDRGDVTTGGGVVETFGTVVRAPGNGAGQVCWGQVDDVAAGYVANNTGAYGGGFSACGGPLTVNLGGDRRTLTLGTTNGFAPQRLRLQDDYATDVLTWENPVDVTNGTLRVQVAYSTTEKTVVWRGAVTSSSGAGGGAFEKGGTGKLVLADGADFGLLAFTANNAVELQVTNRQTLACDMGGSGMWLNKYGDGVTLLSGSNTYANATRVYAGALFVNGTNTGGGSFTVSGGAVLGGSGLIAPKAGASVAVDGTLASGEGAGRCGTLRLGSEEQPTALALNGTLAVDLGASACDRVAVIGDVAMGPAASVTVTVTDEAVWHARRGEQIPVLTWTGGKSGSVTTATALPTGWKVREAPGMLFVSYAASGTLLTVK